VMDGEGGRTRHQHSTDRQTTLSVEELTTPSVKN